MKAKSGERVYSWQRLAVVLLCIGLACCGPKYTVTDVPDLLARGETATAQQLLDAHLTANPEDWPRLFERAGLHQTQGRTDLALVDMEQVRRVLGKLPAEQAQAAEAVDTREAVLVWLYEEYTRTNSHHDPVKALSVLDERISLDPEDLTLLLAKYELLAGMGRYKDCLRVADRWEEIVPDTHYPDYLRAKALLSSGDRDSARETVDGILEQMNPETEPAAEYFLLAARVAQAHREWEDALGYYGNFFMLQPTAAVAVAPSTNREQLTQGWMGRGHVYRHLRQYESSQAAYTAALAVWPGNPEALYALAVLAARKREDDRALELLGQALQAEPDLTTRVQADPAWKRLLGDPRLTELLNSHTPPVEIPEPSTESETP